MHFSRKIGINLICFLSTVLVSCTTLTPPQPAVQLPWKERETKVGDIENWQINGKVAIQTNKNSGSASVDWSQHQDHYVISLMGPLGANALKLIGNPGSVTMQTANGKSQTASTGEQLLAQQGYHLPVSSIRYWVRGLPVPNIPATKQFDASKRLSLMVQQGTRIQYLSYTNVGKIDLPDKIFITSPSLQVKLIIYKWKL